MKCACAPAEAETIRTEQAKGVTVGWKHSFWALAASLAMAAPLAAQTNAICDDLRGQMANLSETVGTNRQLRQYRTAIAEQVSELRKVENDLEDNECSSGSMVIINGDDDGTCGRIEDTLQRMQQNLQELVAKRDQMQRGDVSEGPTRNQLSAALRANGCEDQDSGDTIITNRPPPQAGIEPSYPATPGATTLDSSGGPSGNEPAPQSPIQSYAFGQSYGGGNVRTVCVRTCDGGFFPMTQNASPGDFQRDGETCARMCPGVKTELFFHRLPDQETSAMVSASSGTPYSAMPYAFAFRKRPPNEKTSCTCNLPAYYEEMRKQNALTKAPAAGTQQGSITTIIPKASPPALPTAPAKGDAPPVERPYDPSAGNIRQVGPAFLQPDQRKLDLTRPAAPGEQPQQ